MSLVGGVSRRIEWPTTRISVARPPDSDRDVVLIRGIEPNMRWRGFCDELIAILHRARRRRSSSPSAPCSPTRRTPGPTPVTGSAYDAESARAYGLETSRYEGPTGILGVFQDACVQAGLPAISFWAAVPHYVSQPPSPRATVALLQRVEEVLELTVPLGALPQQAEDWVKTVDEMANEDDEVVEYVRSLEERATEVDLSQANGDTIAREFERYLRRRGARRLIARPPAAHRGPGARPRVAREPAASTRLAETAPGRPARATTGGSRLRADHGGVAAEQRGHAGSGVGVEQPVVHVQREPVGHPRHVVDDLGDRVGLGVAVAGRDQLGVGQVVVDQPPDDVDRHVLLPGGGVGHVDPLEHEGRAARASPRAARAP